jgi:hypothetical protein
MDLVMMGASPHPAVAEALVATASGDLVRDDLGRSFREARANSRRVPFCATPEAGAEPWRPRGASPLCRRRHETQLLQHAQIVSGRPVRGDLPVAHPEPVQVRHRDR